MTHVTHVSIFAILFSASLQLKPGVGPCMALNPKPSLQLKPGDGPCIALLEIIAAEQGPQMAAPSTWKGYHAL